MNKRMIKFLSYKDHPMLGKQFKKLKLEDTFLIYEFLTANISDSKDQLEQKINRLFIDKEKPKNWKIICELLSCSNQ